MEQKPATAKQANFQQISPWYFVLASACILSILAHFVMMFFQIQGQDIPLLALIIFGGAPIVLQLIRKVISGDFGTDMLAVLSFITGVWLGEYVAAVLIVLMLSGGQALEAYAMRKASSVLRALSDRMPSTAHRKNGDKIEEIELSEIQVGDLIIVFPHEAAPVDGVVVEGNSAMDESYMTGEPYLLSKAPGSYVLSGAMNGEAVLVIRSERRAQDSRYAQIMNVMEEAEQKRPVMRRLGDQIGAIFAPVSLLFAIGTWVVTGDPVRFLAVLVVATPCPLLIAIPITIISAISMAAKLGIIIKDPTVLERLPTCRTAIFDKTGTLTYGKPELTEILTAKDVTEDDVLRKAATLERYSKHPLASAILDAANARKLFVMDAQSVSEKQGQGLSGVVDGKLVTVTHRKKFLENNQDMDSLLPPTEAGLECVILMDGKYAATFRFRDAPRAEGKSFISHLGPAHQFKKIMLVSGDRETEVSYLANLLGIKETLASQTPEQKVEIVRAETAKAPTLFMGDGINDAPALTAATVGIAFGQNSSVTAEAAGAVIMDNTLSKVDELIHISGAMRTIVLQSALGGMMLSVVAMGFASGGFITPVAGALLQEVIDVVAILNALRLTFGKKVEIDLEKH